MKTNPPLKSPLLTLIDNQTGVIREFDSYLELRKYALYIEDEKAIAFVKHIKEHLRRYKDCGIPDDFSYDVICKICLMTIDEIWEEERDDSL